MSTADEQQTVYQQLAALIGLPLSIVERQAGRIGIEVFARELLRDQQRIVGLYDASLTAIDPFPDRILYEALIQRWMESIGSSQAQSIAICATL